MILSVSSVGTFLEMSGQYLWLSITLMIRGNLYAVGMITRMIVLILRRLELLI